MGGRTRFGRNGWRKHSENYPKMFPKLWPGWSLIGTGKKVNGNLFVRDKNTGGGGGLCKWPLPV
ncbi:hypothetical protein D3H65_02775 [Paraflavitalea soli]|uniref:Uncharacterized protein n=1 Tax=Paraflavitalea soli TaxID=2315862 RepID=A0A3B7MI15_9BACT|nr:hypothetical protein D3H65_02775 [Paraflavitalea soli]